MGYPKIQQWASTRVAETPSSPTWAHIRYPELRSDGPEKRQQKKSRERNQRKQNSSIAISTSRISLFSAAATHTIAEMGEEEKKPDEKKVEEKKGEEEARKQEEGEKKEDDKEKKDEKKEEKADEEAKEPPPPEEVVLKVYMDCEGCARKVKKCLKGFDGVEDVITDCKAQKVVVKGKKADPVKVLERIQRKSHRKVELLSPIPKPPAEDEKKVEEEKPKVEEKKEEPPPVIVVVLKVHMHCEACAQEMKKRIQKMKGVESAEPDLKSSQVSVKGAFDPQKLVEYVNKGTNKHAAIVRQEPEKKEGGKKGKEEGGKKGGEEGEKEKEGENKEGKGEEEESEDVVSKTNELHYFYCKLATEYACCPQIFSDENPNACTVM